MYLLFVLCDSRFLTHDPDDVVQYTSLSLHDEHRNPNPTPVVVLGCCGLR